MLTAVYINIVIVKSVPKSVLVKLTAFTDAVEPIHYTVHEFLQRQLSS